MKNKLLNNVYMKSKLLLLLLAGIFSFVLSPLYAQKVSVKTNVLYDATSTINLGVEFGLAPKWSLDVNGNYNPWSFSDYKKLKHWMVQPEARYWLCERFNGHFFGVHALGGEFNLANLDLPFGTFSALENMRAQGWFAGGGIAYGYQWILGNHWSLEAELGLGFIHADYKRYECAHCGELLGRANKNYWGITKAAISIIYIIK